MAIEKARIGDIIYDVITVEEYEANPNAYNPKFTAVKYSDGCVYPIRNRTDNRPGFYPTGGCDFFKPCDPSEIHTYSQQNIINFSNKENIREIIEAQSQLANEERAILTTIDNLFVPEISSEDTPETRALKEAVREKHIDIDKYESRFGPNYNNDKRLFRRSSITLSKMKTILNALDMKATLIIEDSAPNVPNPIGRQIIAVITNSDEVDESEELEN